MIFLGFEEKKVLKSFVADITKPETMHIDIFNGVHCVIHAAAETGFSHFPPAKLLEEVNVNGGKKIAVFITCMLLLTVL